VIEIKGIFKSFGSRSVLEDISISAPPGRALCICGPNAVGKTTLLKIIAALLPPDAGDIQIYGFSLQKKPLQAKKLIAVIFHQNMLYPQLTVTENLQFFARLYGIKDSFNRINQLLEKTHLTPYRRDIAGTLSHGIAKRLTIARALLHKPKVLLADEPFAGLDIEAAKHLVDTLSDFKAGGRTVVMTTHNPSTALDCCDQVTVLDDKKLIFNSATSDVDNAEFQRDYLSYARKIS